jgi:hypothetical protein
MVSAIIAFAHARMVEDGRPASQSFSQQLGASRARASFLQRPSSSIQVSLSARDGLCRGCGGPTPKPRVRDSVQGNVETPGHNCSVCLCRA